MKIPRGKSSRMDQKQILGGTGRRNALYHRSRRMRAQRSIDFAAWPRTATFRLKLSQIDPSTREPLPHTRGISRARSFDLEVTPWAPTRLTSCIFHPGPEEASGVSTLEPGPAEQLRRAKLPPNRPASLCCTLVAFPGPEASTWR